MRTCFLGLIVTAGLVAGCAPFKIEPPPGFVEVEANSYEARMKAQDNVGLRVKRFENFRGGTLAYWADDLVKKLDRRGYALVSQQSIRSKNGREGTRFDFKYVDPVKELPKFYSVALFVTDRWKVTLEVAGNVEHGARYLARMNEVAGELKVRGCKPASKICGGPQPPKLSTSTVLAEPAKQADETPPASEAKPAAASPAAAAAAPPQFTQP